MLKPLMITSLLALAAPQADAGDVKIRFGYDSHGNRVRIGVGFRDRDHHDDFRRRVRGRKIRVRHRNHVDVCRPVFVRGHYDTVKRKVWVPGRYVIRYEKVWHGPQWKYTCKHKHHRHPRRRL